MSTRTRVLILLTALSPVLFAGCAPREELPGSESPVAVTGHDFSSLSGLYLGQEPPGREPVVFAPGFVSTGLNELNSVFFPGGRELVYSVSRWGGWYLLTTREQDGRWTKPEVMPFTQKYFGVDPALTPDGKRLVYCSDQPRSGQGEARDDADLWYVERTEDGGWSEPVNLGEPVNSDADEYYPSFTADGTLYFQSAREGGIGGRDLYRARWVDGGYTEPENLGPVVNSPQNEGDVFVAPDESYIIFVQGGRLNISFRGDDDAWTAPQPMDERIPAERRPFCPILSPDGKYFFFTGRKDRLRDSGDPITYDALLESQARPENGSTDVFWVDAGIIEEFRPQA